MIATLKPDPSTSPPDVHPLVTPVDEEAILEDVIRSHGGAVRAVMIGRYRGALGADDIDDVIAVAIHRLWRHRRQFTQLRSPRAWFLRIADNVARDVLRYGWHKARQLEVRSEHGLIEAMPDHEPADHTDTTGTRHPELVAALREIVDDLPTKQRQIVWADALHSHGPVSSDTLAAELGIPAGTVRVYRKRALDRIRKELHKRNLAPEPTDR